MCIWTSSASARAATYCCASGWRCSSDDMFDVYEMSKLLHDMLQTVTAPFRLGVLNRDECTLIRLGMDKSFAGSIPFDSLHELHELHVLYRNEIEEQVRIASNRPPALAVDIQRR